jgi:ABC-type uncharacterized transport system permease subunit
MWHCTSKYCFAAAKFGVRVDLFIVFVIVIIAAYAPFAIFESSLIGFADMLQIQIQIILQPLKPTCH